MPEGMDAPSPHDHPTEVVETAEPAAEHRDPLRSLRETVAGLPRGARWAGGIAGGLLALLLLGYLLAGPLLMLAARAVDANPPDNPELGGLEQPSVVVAADGTVLAELSDEFDREVVDLEQIPEHVRLAVLAAEDRRFYDHDGYDLGAMMRAAWANLRAGEAQQGASTITQQVALANFLERDTTITRKLRELAYARALEDEFTKDEILERYLNEVYLGAGTYGVAAAADEYFRATPEELEIHQAALLAGIIRSPSSLDPRQNPDGALLRRDLTIEAMAEAGFIEREEADAEIAAPMEVADPRPAGPSDAPYVVEAIKREFTALEAFGETREERFTELFNGGYRIVTTVETRLQEAADELVSEYFPEGGGPTAALVSMDPRNGAIRALHGGVDFDEVQFDLATQGRRQPGSAIKPFVLASALEQGFPLEIVLDGDSPLEIEGVDIDEGVWEVNNFGNASLGPVDLREATVRSVNTAYAQLMLASGTEEAISMAEQLGVNAEDAFGEESTWGPSIVLGGVTHGITPLEMARAYAVFANEGRRTQPYLIGQVEDPDGEIVYERDNEEHIEEVLDPLVNAGMVSVLQDVVTAGTATSAQLASWSPLGKTGTTQNSADAWFVGAVPVMSTAVWVGHPEEQVPMDGMTGGSVPAELWQRFMSIALEGIEPRSFADAGADLSGLGQGETTVPDLSGLTQSEALLEAAQAKLIASFTTVDSDAPEDSVVGQSPSPGASARAGDQISVQISTGVAPAPEPTETPHEPEPLETDEPDEEEDRGPDGEGPPGQQDEEDVPDEEEILDEDVSGSGSDSTDGDGNGNGNGNGGGNGGGSA
jgi:penicillin-binding protein 1A